MKEKGIEFTRKNKVIHPDVLCDETKLREIFLNILSNALKYTPHGSISIYACDSDTICIQDTGIGILEEDLPRIFENGFTGYNGRLSPQASGLGLALCKNICRNLNHDISVTSSVGKGTTISIRLNQNNNLTSL